MNVNVKYLFPIRKIVGRDCETFEVNPNINVANLVEEMALKYGEGFKEFMVSSESGKFTTGRVSIGIQREGVIGTKRIEFLNGFDTLLMNQDVVLLYNPHA